VTGDPFELTRFVTAQEGVIEQALRELRAGVKRGHWMWFIFPQLQGLGHSAMAQRYAIHSAEEARAYLAHEVLGPRLQACCEALLDAGRDDPTLTALGALGSPDDLKLRSSMTLFALTADDDAPYRAVLDRYYGGHEDERTVALLRQATATKP